MVFETLASLGVFVVALGGLVWIVGGPVAGRRLVTAGILLTFIVPALGASCSEALHAFAPMTSKVLPGLGGVVALVLFVRFFGAPTRKPGLSLKRRVGDDDR